MEGSADKGPGHIGMSVSHHSSMPVNLGNPLPTNLSSHIASAKNMDAENLEMINHVQDVLNQLSNRGVNSMMVTVAPFGEVAIHGSHKGQAFLKDNAEMVDRFAKSCGDDVWTLIGVQKRFLDIGRANQNKSGQFNEKGDYPLDFSHERGSYFPGQQSNDRSTSQESSLMQGIISQGLNQGKGNFQSNSFNPNSFGQFMGENRPNCPSFFQGGFTQGGHGSETFPQPSFMAPIDTSTNKDYGTLGNSGMTQGSSATSTTIALASQDKTSMQQTEEDLIKEMLNNTPLQDVFKDSPNKNSKGKKGKNVKDESKKEKENNSDKDRERRPEQWQRNIKKKLKIEGKAYINAKGKLMPAKTMKPVDCSKCKLKCNSRISEETRFKIFDWFWKLGSYTAQKEFVISRVQQIATKTSKRRHVHRLFSFDINGKYESCCKPFFSKTLGIGDSYIFKAFEQKARDLFVQDGRGKHAPVNKTSKEQIAFLHRHLDRFLAAYPEGRPLPKNIHAVKWYDEYKQISSEQGRKYVSKHIYRKLFQDYVRKYPPNPDKKKPTPKKKASTALSTALGHAASQSDT